MRSGLLLALLLAVLPPAALSLVAHHAFVGEFDARRPVLLKGTIVKVEMVNPHTWIHVRAKEVTIAGVRKDLKGATEDWAVEGGSPNTLLRRGITGESLAASPEILVDGYQTYDHTLLRANGRNLMLADGRRLFLGSSGSGAPQDRVNRGVR